MNDYNGLREGLHGGSELVQLNGMVTVSPSLPALFKCCAVLQVLAQHQQVTMSLA